MCKTCDRLKEILKPGDVVNTIGHPKWFQVWFRVPCWAIQRHQRKLFGENSRWRDTHSMLYFSPDEIFSVEYPKAVMKPLHKLCQSDLTVYRYTEPDLVNIDTLREGAMEMVGTKYDVGQLLDIAIFDLLGFENLRLLSIFDFGRKRKVCSVGVRAAFEYMWKERCWLEDIEKYQKLLFTHLDMNRWTPEEINEFRGVDVEATAPAHFANSEYFGDEFALVARFKDGVEYKLSDMSE